MVFNAMFVSFLILSLGRCTIHAKPTCDRNQYFDAKNGVCQGCPSCGKGLGYKTEGSQPFCGFGHSLENMKCRPCPKDFYNDQERSDGVCKRCMECEKFYKRKTLKHCTASEKTTCGGCIKGFFKRHDLNIHDYHCQPCNDITTKAFNITECMDIDVVEKDDDKEKKTNSRTGLIIGSPLGLLVLGICILGFIKRESLILKICKPTTPERTTPEASKLLPQAQQASPGRPDSPGDTEMLDFTAKANDDKQPKENQECIAVEMNPENGEQGETPPKESQECYRPTVEMSLKDKTPRKQDQTQPKESQEFHMSRPTDNTTLQITLAMIPGYREATSRGPRTQDESQQKAIAEDPEETSVSKLEGAHSEGDDDEPHSIPADAPPQDAPWKLEAGKPHSIPPDYSPQDAPRKSDTSEQQNMLADYLHRDQEREIRVQKAMKSIRAGLTVEKLPGYIRNEADRILTRPADVKPVVFCQRKIATALEMDHHLVQKAENMNAVFDWMIAQRIPIKELLRVTSKTRKDFAEILVDWMLEDDEPNGPVQETTKNGYLPLPTQESTRQPTDGVTSSSLDEPSPGQRSRTFQQATVTKDYPTSLPD